MSFSRRSLLVVFAGSLLAPISSMAQGGGYSRTPGLAASPSGQVLLEIANFSCPRSFQINGHFDRLRTQAHSRGVDFRFAPITWEKQSIWPSRAYYSFRDLYPNAEKLMRDMLFDGIHREGMRFENFDQVLAYAVRTKLADRALKLYPEFSEVAWRAYAEGNEPLISESKSVRLIDRTGAMEVPVFLWIAEGEIKHSVAPEDVGGDTRALLQVIQDSLYSR